MQAKSLAEELQFRKDEILEVVRRGGKSDALWLEVLSSGVWLDARANGMSVHSMLVAELLKIRGRDGKLRALEANRAQREFESRRGKNNIVLKARQMGISTWIAGRVLMRTLLQPGTTSLLVAHTEDASAALLQIVQRFYTEMPPALRSGVWRAGRKSRERMYFPALDSEVRIASAGQVNAGRGLTVQNLHCAEVARWGGDAEETLAGLRAALAPGGELTMESTPNGAAGAFYREWHFGTDDLVRHFFPWWLEKSYVSLAVPEIDLTDEERVLMERENLTRSQIGYRRSLVGQHRRLAAQEYAEDAESCFLASGRCVFDEGALAEAAADMQAPVRSDRDRLLTWCGPAAGRKYVIGVDSAGGGYSGDYSAIQVIDAKTGMQCAEWQAIAPPKETGEMTVRLADEYGNCCVVIEKNNHGHVVLAYVAGKVQDLYCQGGNTGWTTSSASRPEMISLMEQTIASKPGVLRSERLLAECRSFVWHDQGSPRAAGGSHDDLVMAMALALSVRAERMGNGRDRDSR